MKKILTLALVAAMVLSVGLTGCASKPTTNTAGTTTDTTVKKETLKMSVTTSDTSTWVQGANKFAELVAEKTNGQIEIKVFPNEQLAGGSQSKGVEMLMSGSTDISFHSNIIYSIMDEKFGVISLPFLIPDVETADKLLDGAGGEALNKLLLEKNIVGLGYGENGYREITNSKLAIKTPDDMKGLKIRIPGIKMYVSLYKTLGADPVSMNFSEVFTALQQKTIDGQENPTDVISSSKIHEVQDYMTVWDYSYDSIILGMNKAKFESYDAATQQILRDCAKEACAYQRKLNRELSAKQVQQFKDAGVEVTELTAEQKAAFKEKVQPVYTEYEPIMSKELIAIFNQK